MPKWPHLEVAKVGIFQMMFDHPSSPKKNKAKSCNVHIMNLHLGPTINHKILAWLQLLSWHPSFFTFTISLPFSSTRLNMMESIFIFIFNINSKYSWVYVRSSSNLVNWLSFKWGASWDTTCSASSSFTRSHQHLYFLWHGSGYKRRISTFCIEGKKYVILHLNFNFLLTNTLILQDWSRRIYRGVILYFVTRFHFLTLTISRVAVLVGWVYTCMWHAWNGYNVAMHGHAKMGRDGFSGVAWWV